MTVELNSSGDAFKFHLHKISGHAHVFGILKKTCAFLTIGLPLHAHAKRDEQRTEATVVISC